MTDSSYILLYNKEPTTVSYTVCRAYLTAPAYAKASGAEGETLLLLVRYIMSKIAMSSHRQGK